MNLFTGEASDAFFGGEVPPAVHALMHQAASAAPGPREALLWTAQALAPSCLAVYYTLYKHHASRREFMLAERAARRGLAEAARQAGLDDEGRPLPRADGAPPAEPDFQRDGPARFWLFTHKALAFICVRSGQPDEARRVLARLERLGAQAGVGDEVTRGLLAAADGDVGDGDGPGQPPIKP